MSKEVPNNAYRAMIIMTGLSMLITGLLYPISTRYTLAIALVNTYSEVGFFLWCSAMISAGVALIFFNNNIRAVGLLTLPLLGMVISTATTHNETLTAIIYYALWWVIPNYMALRIIGQGNSRLSRILYWFDLHRTVALGMVLMGCVLWIKPFGSGLEYVYAQFSWMDNPVLNLRFWWLVSGVTMMLLPETLRDLSVTYLLTLPIFFHGMMFTYIILIETYAWSVLPAFVGVSAILFLSMVDRYKYE